MAQITWLHLSDWHQNSEKHDRKVLSDKLREDLRARESLDPRLAQVNFVVFSGDAANHGKTEEFKAVRDVLFAPVLELLELKPERLFIVPGNHDLDRSHVEEMLPAKLQSPLADHEAVKHWLCDDKRRGRALEPFAAFEAFVREYTGQDNPASGQDSPAYAFIRRLELADKSVALLGLNTAWMCGRHKDDKDKVDDKGHIVIGEPQIHDALGEIADADLRIIVQHHAFEWLAEFDRDMVEARLKDAADVILWGHEHRPKARFEDGTEGKCLIIPGGAAFGERTATNPRYANAYNLTTLNAETGAGEVFIRTWDDDSTSWVAKAKGGRFPFTLPRAADKPPPPPETQERRHARAAARYQELLLKSCDIVNLANLPEQDQHIAVRQLELRRLYVPLSVMVEPVSDAKAEQAFDNLEARRAAVLGRGELRVVGAQQRAAPGERLKEAKRLVVLGDPGSGKTTLTRWFATAFLLKLKNDPAWEKMPAAETLPETPYLPVLVRCRDLDGAVCKATLDDVLKHTLREDEFSNASEEIHAYLRQEIDAGRALLILDGLDEINDPTLRARFCEQMDRIARANNDLPIIVTSRIVGYRELGVKLSASFEHLTLPGFDRDEKDAFARNWCRLVEPPERRETAAAALIRDIHSNDRIERLTANPMLLTTMALVKRSVGRLPHRRIELYDEAVKVLLKWRSELDTPLDGREALPQLQYLAYAMCDRGVQRLPKEDALALLAQLREKHPSLREVANHAPEDFLVLVESRTGILMEAGRERINDRLTPVYEFRHLTIQEYLASRALVERVFPGVDPTKTLAQLVAPLAGRTGESETFFGRPEIMLAESWREPLRLLTAGCSDHEVDPVLKTILKQQNGILETILTSLNEIFGTTSTPLNLGHRDNRRARAVQAALCLADEPAVSDDVAQKVIDALVAVVGGGDNPGTSVGIAVGELAVSRWKKPLSAVLVGKFLIVPAAERVKYGVLTAEANLLRDATPTEVAAWLKDKMACLTGPDATAAEAALGILSSVAERQIQASQELVDQLAACLTRAPAVAHAAAWALFWEIDRARGEVSPPTPALLAYLGRPNTDDEAAKWCLSTMGQSNAPLLSDLYHRYRHHDDRAVRQSALAAVSAGLPGEDRILLTEDLDGIEPFLDPAKPLTLDCVKEAAKRLKVSESDIRARYVELAKRFHLTFDFDFDSE